MDRALKAAMPHGRQLLEDARLNKDTAFTEEERDRFGLRGLIPSQVLTIENQVELVVEHISHKSTDLEKYIGLSALRERNETLFYRVLIEHLEELMPIVYTPTVGQACQLFSHIMRRPMGLWITPDDIDRIPSVLGNAAAADIRLIVVTDNERILGLGDQGAGGMGIPLGKIALYCAGAGVPPRQCLPISLDVGTDNEMLLNDPLYLGFRGRRLRGERYEQFIDAFIEAVIEVYPHAVLQWEDFHKNIAFQNLSRYQHRLASFNDDIQGTAGVALAGFLNAVKVKGENLADQRILYVGAGAAGIGIARLVKLAMQHRNIPAEVITRSQLFFDTRSVVHDGRAELDLDPPKLEFMFPVKLLHEWGLQEGDLSSIQKVVEAYKPTMLIGTTATPGVFHEQIIRAMGKHVEQPVIMPFSNPNSKAEIQPADAIKWTDGRAIVASGSPFDPVDHGGRRHLVGQGNNVFVFPGIGLGAIVAEAHTIPQELFLVAAETLADATPPNMLEQGSLYPNQGQLREISFKIACAVVRKARDLGIGRLLNDEQVEQKVSETMWYPEYRHLETRTVTHQVLNV